MTAKQLKKLLQQSSLTQTAAARELGITDRQVRRYIAGDVKIPRAVEIAITFITDTRKGTS